MKKVVQWMAGILAGIIGSVAVYYLTRPAPPPAVTTFEGMVYSGSSPVAHAMVQLDLDGVVNISGPIHDITNENGAYRFELTGLPNNASAKLLATANGYAASSAQSLLSPLQRETHLDFPLSPVVIRPAPPSGLGAAVGQHTATPAQIHIPLYIAKGASQAMKIQIAH
ncbi:MAG: hypothetical protein JST28_13575 [Acidobacteria bacterium]|nr:hypothetical protein [Acidobacteriota bacterium]